MSEVIAIAPLRECPSGHEDHCDKQPDLSEASHR